MTTPARPTAERVYYFDYLRLWATCGVVLLHTSAAVFTHYHHHRAGMLTDFTIGNIGDSLGRFGVGCFFMVSGALLLSPAHRFRLVKQLIRVVIPLFVWAVIYALFQAYFAQHHLPKINGSNTHPLDFGHVLKSFVSAPPAYHLWFVYVLVGIYLVMPILRPVTALPDERRGQLLRYALGLWIVFTLAIPAVQHLWPGRIPLYAPAFPPVPIGYLGTVLLGFYLHHHGVPLRSRSVLVLGMAAGVSACVLITNYELTHRHGSAWALNNLTPQITLYAACVFLLAKLAFDRPGRAYPFVALFSRISYRIYLVHALVLHYLRAISPLKHWYLDRPALSIPVIAALTLVISFLLSWAIEQLRPIRNYI